MLIKASEQNVQDVLKAMLAISEEVDTLLDEVIMEEANQDDEEDDDDCPTPPQLERVCTFEEGGVLTMNKGLVIELTNGQVFQVTIVEA